MQNIMKLIKNIPNMVEECKLVVFIIDGLGITQLKLPKKFRREMYETVFPSSTSTFFYSFHSLLEPKVHGFLEWYMRLKRFEEPILVPPWKTLSGRELKLGKEVKKKDVFPFKSLSEILWKRGLSSCYYTPFANSTATRAMSRKARVVKIEYLSEIFPLPDADFTYIYWPSVDSILHECYKDEKFQVEKELIEFYIKLLWKKLPRKRKLLVLSDHGLVRAEKIYKLPLVNGIYPVGGGRVAFYKGVEKEQVEKRLNGIPARVFYLKELKGFEGRISKRCYENYGEVVVLAQRGGAFQYPFEGEVTLKGFHGGFLKEEHFINVWMAQK